MIDWAARILSQRADYGGVAADVYSQYRAAATVGELSEKLRLSPLPEEIKTALCAAKAIDVRRQWDSARVPVTNVEAQMPFGYYRKLPPAHQRALRVYIELGCDQTLLDTIIQIYAPSVGITPENFLADADVSEILATFAP